MATLKECTNALYELEAIWESGNQNSLHFCRYTGQTLEELSWEFIMQDEDIPADIEQLFNMLEDDIYDCYRHAREEANNVG